MSLTPLPVLYLRPADIAKIPVVADAEAAQAAGENQPRRWQADGEWHVFWNAQHALVRPKVKTGPKGPRHTKPKARH